MITMKCKCKSNPKPVVTWYRGTNVVKESAKIKMTVISKEEDIYEMSLEIKVRTRNMRNVNEIVG